MKIEKIDVQTSNKKHATDIAMLVDKPEFLQEIQRLRQKWQITDKYKGKDKYLDENALLYYTGLNKKEADERLPEFNTDIDNILKAFNRGKNFKLVVIHALLTGAIPTRTYKSCYFDIVTINEAENVNKPENYQYVIVMSPRTEKQEVEQAYYDFQEHIKGREEEKNFTGKIGFENLSNAHKYNMDNPDDVDVIEHYYKGNAYNSADITKFKTLKELERTREWYWIAYLDKFNTESSKRKRTEDILTEWQLLKCPVQRNHDDIEGKKTCPFCSIEDINIVDQALSAYSKLLNQS